MLWYSLVSWRCRLLLSAATETGLPHTGVTKKIWANSWIYGLVPPSAVDAQNHCPDGVAQVETQITFVNGLVGSLTFGVYTPMEILVTCASPAASIDARGDSLVRFGVPEGSGYSEIMAAFRSASG